MRHNFSDSGSSSPSFSPSERPWWRDDRRRTEPRRASARRMARPRLFLLANNWTDPTDGALAAGITVDETGANPTISYASANALINGTGHTPSVSCRDRTDSTAAGTGRAGETSGIGFEWADSFPDDCNSTFLGLHCFRHDLPIRPAPPSAAGIVGRLRRGVWARSRGEGGTPCVKISGPDGGRGSVHRHAFLFRHRVRLAAGFRARYEVAVVRACRT